MTLFPWEAEFVRSVEAADGGTVALSVARGAGKTALVAALAAAAVAGPWAQRRGLVLLVAGTFKQARIAFGHVRAYLAPIIEGDPGRWKVWDSQQAAAIIDKRTGASLEAREAVAGSLHGAAPVLILADEPAQWVRSGERMYAALRTSLGKLPGSRALFIGTRPAGDDHWFARLLARSGTVYAADRADDPFAPATWTKANPSLPYLPALEQAYQAEAADAQRDESLLPGFQALRLNMGVADALESLLLDAATWERCEVGGDLPAARGGPVLGVDLGSGAAMSAAAAYWPATGRLEAFAMFAAVPTLAERGRRDAVADLYMRMARRGELSTCAGRVVPVPALLSEALARWGRPAAIIADRYREHELRQALDDARFPQADLIFRGQGFRDGAADVRGFRAACLSGSVRVNESLLLRYAIGEARVISDPAGNEKLAKGSESGRRARARDDAAAAVILAVAGGARRGVVRRPRYRSVVIG